MSLSKVPNLRRLVLISVFGTVTLLMAGVALPGWQFLIVAGAAVLLSLPFVFWSNLWPRKARKGALERIRGIEFLWEIYSRGEITKADFDRLMRDPEQHRES